MSGSLSSRRIEALRGWLQGELGDAANIYHQCAVYSAPDAGTAHRFSISVPVGQMTDLLLLRKRRGLLRRDGIALTVVRIDPEGEVQSRGAIARRDFVIHFKGDA